MQSGETPFMIAVHEGEEGVVRNLLAKNANVHAKDEVLYLSDRCPACNRMLSKQLCRNPSYCSLACK